MIKIIFIVSLILVGILATKYLDPKTQKNGAIAFGVLLALGALSVVISELMIK